MRPRRPAPGRPSRWTARDASGPWARTRRCGSSTAKVGAGSLCRRARPPAGDTTSTRSPSTPRPSARPRLAVAVATNAVHLWRNDAWQAITLPAGARSTPWPGTTDGCTPPPPADCSRSSSSANANRSSRRSPACPPVRSMRRCRRARGHRPDHPGRGLDRRPRRGRLRARAGRMRASSCRIPPAASDAARDSLGTIWAGSRACVVRYHRLLGLEFLDRESGMVANGIEAVTVDREGQVWLVGRRGISMLADARFRSWDRETGLFADEVSAVHELRRRDHPAGPRGRADHSSATRVRASASATRDAGAGPWPSPPRATATCGWPAATSAWRSLDQRVPLALDHGRPELRAAPSPRWRSDPTARSGPAARKRTVARRATAHSRPVPLTTADDPTPPSLRRILVAADGSLYLTCGRRGVIRVDGERVQRFVAADEPEANSTYAVFPAPDGGWWVGTAVGLRRLGDGALDAGAADGPGDRPRPSSPSAPTGTAASGSAPTPACASGTARP